MSQPSAKGNGIALKGCLISLACCGLGLIILVGIGAWYGSTPEGQAASKKRADERAASEQADRDRQSKKDEEKRQADEAKKQAAVDAATSTTSTPAPDPAAPAAASAAPAIGTVPNLVGMTYRDAMKQLKGLGFTSVTYASSTPGDTRQKDDLWFVVAQLPNPGTADIPVDTPVTLSIAPSMPPPPTTEKPIYDADTKDGVCKDLGLRNVDGISAFYFTYDVSIVNTGNVPARIKYRIYFTDDKQYLSSLGPDGARWGGYSADGWLTTNILQPGESQLVGDGGFVRGTGPTSGKCGVKLEVGPS